MTSIEATVRSRLLESHRGTLAAVVEAGRTVAEAWPAARATESGSVTEPLERVLRARDLTGDLLALLHDGTDAIGEPIRGNPIPAPPYLAVTSRGPVCRATMPDDRRLVVVLELFAVERHPTAYRFADPDPESCLQVSIR